MPFCGSCGRELAEGEVCHCQDNVKTNRVKKDRKVSASTIKGVCIFTVMIAIVVLVVFLIIDSKRYLNPVKDICKEINKGMKSDYVSLETAGLPSECVSILKKIAKLNPEKMDASDISSKNQYDALLTEYPNLQISFEAASKEKMQKEDRRVIKQRYDGLWNKYFRQFRHRVEMTSPKDEALGKYSDLLGVDENEYYSVLGKISKYLEQFEDAKVSKGYKITGCYVLKNGDLEIDRTEPVTISMIKLNGKWVIDSYSKTATFTKKVAYFLNEYISRTFESVVGTLSSMY